MRRSSSPDRCRRASARPPAAPQGLRAFLLRPSEAVTHEFARTPSFSWLPVSGAVRYEFELSKNAGFTEAGTFWSDEKLKTPAQSPCPSPFPG